jgi:hypothetical protein
MNSLSQCDTLSTHFSPQLMPTHPVTWCPLWHSTSKVDVLSLIRGLFLEVFWLVLHGVNKISWSFRNIADIFANVTGPLLQVFRLVWPVKDVYSIFMQSLSVAKWVLYSHLYLICDVCVKSVPAPSPTLPPTLCCPWQKSAVCVHTY